VCVCARQTRWDYWLACWRCPGWSSSSTLSSSPAVCALCVPHCAPSCVPHRRKTLKLIIPSHRHQHPTSPPTFAEPFFAGYRIHDIPSTSTSTTSKPRTDRSHLPSLRSRATREIFIEYPRRAVAKTDCRLGSVPLVTAKRSYSNPLTVVVVFSDFALHRTALPAASAFNVTSHLALQPQTFSSYEHDTNQRSIRQSVSFESRSRSHPLCFSRSTLGFSSRIHDVDFAIIAQPSLGTHSTTVARPLPATRHLTTILHSCRPVSVLSSSRVCRRLNPSQLSPQRRHCVRHLHPNNYTHSNSTFNNTIFDERRSIT